MLISPSVLFHMMLIYYILNMIFPTTFTVNDAVDRIYPQIAMALICCYCLLVTFVNLGKIFAISIFRPFLFLVLFAMLWIPFSKNGFGDVFGSFVSFLKFDMGILYMFAIFLMLIKHGEKMEKYLFLMYFIQVLYVFYCLIIEKKAALLSDSKIFDSNSGFMMVCCIPMALLLPIKRVRIYLVILLIGGCIVSGQRSAALAAIVSFPFCISILKNELRHTDFIYIGILFVIIGLPILQSAIENILARNALDVKSGGFGSGRNVFWGIVWNSFWKGDFVNILLGNGINSVPDLLKKLFGIAIGAHNGWLDHLYSFGIIGVVLYSFCFIFLLKGNSWINSSFLKYHNVLLVATLVFFMKSVTSHGYWNIDANPLTGMVSYLMYRLYYENDTEECTYEDWK